MLLLHFHDDIQTVSDAIAPPSLRFETVGFSSPLRNCETHCVKLVHNLGFYMNSAEHGEHPVPEDWAGRRVRIAVQTRA
jgi:hypothetical protein